MECDYEAFDNYPFDKDERFQHGFQKLERNMQLEEKLRAKVFYYNKFVKPVDLEGYKRWVSFKRVDFEDLEMKPDLICERLQQQETVNTICVNTKQKMELEVKSSTEVHRSTELPDEQRDDIVEVRSDSTCCREERLTETIKTECSLSFSEILHIIETGQEIPGLQKLSIIPTNQSPTVSHMLPKPKPWDNTK